MSLRGCVRLFAVVLLVSAGGFLPGDDSAPGPGAPHRELREQLGASMNNLGVQNSLELSWIWPLATSRRALLSDAHFAAGVSHAVTPSYTRLGAWAELSPLSILDLRVGVEPTQYFGTFESLMSFDAYGDAFDNDARKLRGGARRGTAMRAYASPTVKFKLGALVAVASADFEWWRSSAPGPLFYEPARDTLLKADGDALVNTSSALLYQHELGAGGKLSSGLIHQLTYVYAAPSNRVERLGVVVVREFGSRRLGLPHPRLLGTVSRYLADPSKKDEWSAGLALGFRSTR